MSQLYSGHIRAKVTTEGYTLSIVGFADKLKIKVTARAVINGVTYQVETLKFILDEPAFIAVLKSVNAVLNEVTVLGKKHDLNSTFESIAPFRDVSLEQLITAGLLVPLKQEHFPFLGRRFLGNFFKH